MIDFDNINFDFSFEEKTELDFFIKLKCGELKKTNIIYKNAKQLVNDIDIKKGDRIYVNLAGRFEFGQFIPAFIQENNLQVEELTIVTLSGSMEDFECLDELIVKKWVKKINLLISDYFIETEKKKFTPVFETLKNIKEKNNDNFNIFVGRNHAKIILIKTKKGGYVTIHGSANLRSSGNYEQMCIEENKELYDFNYEFFKLITNGKKEI